MLGGGGLAVTFVLAMVEETGMRTGKGSTNKAMA